MEGLRAIMVSVDYTDFLRITLPYNRHHFEDVLVVTAPGDEGCKELCAEHGVRTYVTDAFFRDGAVFNKWRALEEGLDYYGREGWLCIMDADVLWPQLLDIYHVPQPDPCGMTINGCALLKGCLYGPLRRMFTDMSRPVPAESEWKNYKVHHNINEWAGYSQVFHAQDGHLPPPPWHEIDWAHAGGADSFFQNMWDREHKVRLPFEVLHLGSAGHNWYGRSTPYLDGSHNPLAQSRRARINEIARMRGRYGWSTGVYDRERYKGEKIVIGSDSKEQLPPMRDVNRGLDGDGI